MNGRLLGRRPGPAWALCRALWLLAREAPATAALVVVAGVVPAGLAALSVEVSRRLFAAIFAGAPVLGPAAAYAGVLLAGVLVGRAHGIAALRWNARLQAGVRAAFLRQVARLRLEALADPAVQDVLSRAEGVLDGPRLVRALQHVLMSLPRSLQTAVGLAVGLAALNPWLLVAVVAAGLPTTLVALRRGPAFYWFAEHRSRRYRAMDYVGGLLAGRGAAAEVRALGWGPQLLSRWRAEQGAVLAERTAFEVRRLPADLLAHLAGNGAVGYGLGLVWTIGLTLAGRLDVAACAAALTAMWGFQDAFRGVAIQLGNAGTDGLAFADVVSVLDAPAVERPEAGRAFPAPLREGLALEEVTFTYPGQATPALRGVTLRVRAGERVALVGANGAGKTTAVRLLLGLYAPRSGRVTADGVPLADIAPASLRADVAAVFAEPVRYALPLRDNIALGNLGATGDPAAVREALRRGGAEAVADEVPGGLDAWLDPSRAGGVGLSGGQWQRVAMARAAMRPGAAVAVFDEPTAALDPEREAEVFADLLAAAAGRTAVFVSHRLGLARYCDRVIVMDAGRVVEEGTHEELVARGGMYARMWRIQAAWYA